MGGQKKRLKELFIKRQIKSVYKKMPKKMPKKTIKCFYCGIWLYPDNKTIDHKTPICLGGSNGKSNKVLACFRCNQEKGSIPFDEWMEKIKLETKNEKSP